jgi:hypothetical protein
MGCLGFVGKMLVCPSLLFSVSLKGTLFLG